MLDSKLLRGNIDFVAEQLKRRKFTFDVAEFNKLEDQRKVIQVQTQDLQNLRNTKSKAIGQAKASGENMQPLLDEVSELGQKLDDAKSKLQDIQAKIEKIVMAIPNIPHPSVPEGDSEDDNIILQSTKELGKIVGTSGNNIKQREVGLLGVFQGFSPDELEGATRDQKQISDGESK